MRRALILLWLAACGGGGGGDDGDDVTSPDAGIVDPSADFYDPDFVPDIRITLSQASMDALAAAPYEYTTGDIQIGDDVIPNVGVRLKGEYNFRTLDAKAAFKIKFNEYASGQTYLGLHRLTLNNSLEDPAFVAERLVYTAFRAADSPAPRANTARVYVNDQWYGVYINIETTDKVFLHRWYDDDDGNLYEEMGAEFFPGNEGAFELETNTTADDRSDLTGFFAAIQAADDATLDTDLEGVLDVDQFLRSQALEGILDQPDGYGYTQFGPNNFRIYHEPASNHFTYIPWGMDMSLKPYGGGDINLMSPTGMLMQRCLAGDACRARYIAAIRAMCDVIDGLDLPAQADAMHAQIAQMVADDPRKEVDTQTFEAVFAAEREFLTRRTADVRASLP